MAWKTILLNDWSMRNHCLYCKCNWFYSNALLENNCSKALKDLGEQDWLETRWSNKGSKSIGMLICTWSIFPAVSGLLPGCPRLLYTVHQSTHFSKILGRKRINSTASSENTLPRVSFCVVKKWFWFSGKSRRLNVIHQALQSVNLLDEIHTWKKSPLTQWVIRLKIKCSSQCKPPHPSPTPPPPRPGLSGAFSQNFPLFDERKGRRYRDLWRLLHAIQEQRGIELGYC